MKSRSSKLLAFAVACLAVPALSQGADREHSVEIERQMLEDALSEFSQQTGMQIGYFAEGPSKDILVGPLSGRYTADAAMSQLLSLSGFRFERINERTIVVTMPVLTKSSPGGSHMQRTANTEQPSSQGFMQLAQLRISDDPSTDNNLQGNEAAANAQAPDKKERLSLEEIVVTAQRREERLQDVPISISVLTGDDLDSSTVTDVTEALSRVPGVTVNQSWIGGFSQVPVRGVAAQESFATGSTPTAYYLDSVPFGFATYASAPDPDAYDLERVEVLRGPQGTLYGANALNGVVRVLTKDAKVDEFALKARGMTSTTEDGGENYRVDAAVNVPIIEGKLAARAVVGYQDLGGWIDKPHHKDANDSVRRTLRLKIHAQPTEELSIDLSSWLSRADYGGVPVGTENRTSSIPVDESISTDYDVFGLKIGYELPWAYVTSATSYLDYANEFDLFFGVTLDMTLDAKTFAQEVTFNSTQEGAWRWSAGGMYRDSEDRDIEFLSFIPTTPQSIRNRSKSYAIFGELTRSFLDEQWELTAGLRYFEDNLAQFEDSRWIFSDEELPVQFIDSEATFSATTPRLVLAWHPSEQKSVYASYSEGFRSGWHQAPVVLTIAPFPPVEPDKLKNYEVGAKGALLGGRLSFDTALYYIDWQDVQQSIAVPLPGGVFNLTGVNGESASGVGVDLALTAAPSDRVELGVSLSWNDLSMDADVFSEGVVLFEKGGRPNNSAEYTVGASADYAFPFGRNGLEGRISASANYTSEQEYRLVAGGERSSLEGDPILIARSSVSISAQDRWTATLFADNLNNERGSPIRLASPDRTIRLRPRTFGMQLEYRF